jgi:Nif-specific regulatory protein
MGHRWPGNVREQENCVERAAVMSENGTIDRDLIRIAGLDNLPPAPGDLREAAPEVDLNDPDLDERERVIAALEKAARVKAKAAPLLNSTPRQIACRIRILRIRVRQH